MMMEKKSCKEYTQEKIQKLIGEGKTLLELTELDIPIDDRIWIVTMFLSDKINRKFAIWCARRCKINIQAITDYIDLIEKHYNGKETKEALKAARSAVNLAAYHTACYAADSAAYSAARSAAYCAAYHAADYAAYYAACYAAYYVAYYAADSLADHTANFEVEQKLQIEKLRELIKSEGGEK